jgi:putative sterol carrier protein
MSGYELTGKPENDERKKPMESEAFRRLVAAVVGRAAEQPEMRGLDGSRKILAFKALDLPDVAWHLDGHGALRFVEGAPEHFDVQVGMESDDFVQVFSGKLSPTQAIMRRRMKIEGSIMTVMGMSADVLVRCYHEVVSATEGSTS